MTAAEARELTKGKQKETFDKDLNYALECIEKQAKLGYNNATLHNLKDLVKEHLTDNGFKVKYQNKFGTWLVSW